MFSDIDEKQFYTNSNPTERQKNVAKLLVQQMIENRKNPDIVKSGVIPRSIIDKNLLTDDDLLNAGFRKSLIAVPETGQSKLTTYRHIYNNLHFHKHPKNWLFHEDKYPALSMMMARYINKNPNASFADKAKYFVKSALPESASHIVYEGLPGWVNWISNSIAGTRGLQHSDTFNTKDFMIRSMAGATGLSALESALSGGEKGLETLPGNFAALAGMVAGNKIATNLYNTLTAKDDKFSRPSMTSTAVLAGIPILTALVSKYGTNTLINKLIKKDN